MDCFLIVYLKLNFFKDSRRWMPTKILADLTSSGKSENESVETTSKTPPLKTSSVSSNGNTQQNNIIFNALHIIEHEIFYSERSIEQEQIKYRDGAGLLEKSLIYLLGTTLIDNSSN